ncbi:MAG: rhomboid family intramembrane serine protease [Acidilobaceae archaeon]
MISVFLRTPITFVLVFINTVVYALASYRTLFLTADTEWIEVFAFTPAKLLYISEWYRIFTAMFMHANLFHILFNMYFLAFFGRDVEVRLNSFRYLILYLASGVLASAFHVGLIPLTGSIALVIPAVGASGAISGVLGAYLTMFPKRSLSMCILFPIPMCFKIYAGHFLMSWLAFQVVLGILSYGTGGGGVAFFAHVGGFLSGILLTFLLLFSRRSQELKLPQGAPVFVIVRKTGLSRSIKLALLIVVAIVIGGAMYSMYIAESLSGVYVFEIETQRGGLTERDKAIYSLSDNKVILPLADGPRVVFNRLLWAGVLVRENAPNSTITDIIFNNYIEVTEAGTYIAVWLSGRASYDEKSVLKSLEGDMITDVLLVRAGVVTGVEKNVYYRITAVSEDVADEVGASAVRVCALISTTVSFIALIVSLAKDEDLAEEEIEYIYPIFPTSI